MNEAADEILVALVAYELVGWPVATQLGQGCQADALIESQVYHVMAVANVLWGNADVEVELVAFLVTKTSGEIGGMEVGSTVEAEYDIPADAWYFAENGARTMPRGSTTSPGRI